MKEEQSVENVVQSCHAYPIFSSLKTNLTKCEVAGIAGYRYTGSERGQSVSKWHAKYQPKH